MAGVKEYALRSWGWENDPEEERFPMSTLDYLTTTTWANMALFFEVEDERKKSVTGHLKVIVSC